MLKMIYPLVDIKEGTVRFNFDESLENTLSRRSGNVFQFITLVSRRLKAAKE